MTSAGPAPANGCAIPSASRQLVRPIWTFAWRAPTLEVRSTSRNRNGTDVTGPILVPIPEDGKRGEPFVFETCGSVRRHQSMAPRDRCECTDGLGGELQLAASNAAVTPPFQMRGVERPPICG